jgi:hypothetical protein
VARIGCIPELRQPGRYASPFGPRLACGW